MFQLQVYLLSFCSLGLPLQQIQLVFFVRFLGWGVVAHIALSKSWVTWGAVLCACLWWFTFLYGGFLVEQRTSQLTSYSSGRQTLGVFGLEFSGL
ncbi:hypothetical protein, partial [Vibrio scophthalmi]|uniref:hypothetical protein n=1 Tax=Vibrio scophthalmi TaxID=45658 RepID=UPI002FF12E1A